MGLFSRKSDDGGRSGNAEKRIVSYKVTYKGGLLDYPKSKAGAIEFNMFDDRFELNPTIGSKWFSSLTIPYSDIEDLKIVERQVGTAEGILGGLDSRQLNQKNNIHITYKSNADKTLLRLEMLTGVTVMGQAKKCQEFEDRLNTYGVRQKFPSVKVNQNNDVVEKLKSLSALRQQGVLTEEEFQKAKRQLLA